MVFAKSLSLREKSPSGRGCREAAGEGRLGKVIVMPALTRPSATLSQRERDRSCESLAVWSPSTRTMRLQHGPQNAHKLVDLLLRNDERRQHPQDGFMRAIQDEPLQ